ncbi:MAG: PIG-L family deacetylase [Candidatus Hydrogenedens sp.]|nr:PIG-L family deacetylase [Candidatus Hydrogenedens sp.]
MHTAMIFSPHADDASAFCGGTLAKWSANGWNIILVRVTDDARDSVGLTIEETVKRNRAELEKSCEILGIKEIIDLNFPTDTLADIPLTKLRERFVYLMRKYKPYAIFSFDPYAHFEPNMDHVRVARAVEEALWVSCFDLHHPEHFKEGLEPFSVCERWYFARNLEKITYVENITDYFPQKVHALSAHETMMRNLLQSFRLQLKTWGYQIPLIEDAFSGDYTGLLEQVLYMQASGIAEECGMPEGTLAEPFRVERFGDMEAFFQQMAEPIDGTTQGPKRPFLDTFWSEE